MSDVEQAVSHIRNGGVIAVPTDTVYGLGCDPADAAAVERIYEIKRRPAGLELNLLAASRQQLEAYAVFDELGRRLADAYWPGPLSLVLPVGRARLAIPREGSTLMVRVPASDVLSDILAVSGPIASTSANRHGEPPANDADAVRTELGDDIDLVVEGASGGGVASTIIDCTTHPPRILRQGPIASDELRAFWEAP